jgi:hypothetical protein
MKMPRYELAHYDGREINVRSVTRAEVDALRTSSVDHFHSRCLGLFSFQPASGKRIEYREKWPLIGDVGLAILHSIQLNPGAYVSAKDLAEMIRRSSLTRPGVLAARVFKLRQAHREKGTPRFIVTNTACGYHLMWPAERTWMSVERIPNSNH